MNKIGSEEKHERSVCMYERERERERIDRDANEKEKEKKMNDRLSSMDENPFPRYSISFRRV